MAGTIIIILAGGILGTIAYGLFCNYCKLKGRVKEKSFEKLMRKQLELDMERIQAYDDMLWEACWSKAEKRYKDEYKEY